MAMLNQTAQSGIEEKAQVQRELAHARYQYQQVNDSINQLKRHGVSIPNKLEYQYGLLVKEIDTLETRLKI